MSFSRLEDRAFPLRLIPALICLTLLAACADDENTYAEPANNDAVEVTAILDHAENLHLFEMSAQEVSSGWTTFRFTNASPVDHFFLIMRLPDEAIDAAHAAGDPLLDHWFQAITVPFQVEFNPYIRGDIDYEQFVDNLVSAIQEKAPWFFDPGVPSMGGPGLTSVGRTSETTVYLEPGEYIVECYVRDENDVFHSYIGMLDHLTVTDDASGADKPVSTVNLTISSTNGIQVDQALSRGSHIVEILFEDQTSYAHLLGHNVQLVKLSEKDDAELLDELAVWMDWREEGGLVDRAPDGAEFVGGVMEMTEGAAAYLHVDLEPGDYAWIAEIPDPAGHGMLKTFTVPD